MAHAKTGRSLPVPNVQALAETCNELVPERFVRSEKVCAEDVVVASAALPVVDLGRLLDPESSEEELANLGSACQNWGFFQLVNHGVLDEVIQDVRRDVAEFFKLPLEAKQAYVQLPESGLEGYGQAFVFSETQKLDWSDMLYLMVRPTESRDMRFWPAQPPSFRSSVDRYSAEAAKVVSWLLQLMAADIGLKQPERLLEAFGGVPQTMKVNYYPPCTQAGEVIGLAPHTDACGLTLLLHVDDVQGLQMRTEDGKWLAVDPPLDGAFIINIGDILEQVQRLCQTPPMEFDGAFIINIGDILEILSNGRFRSIEHRAMVHPNKERITVALFHQVCPDTTVGPLPELVNGSCRARYRSVSHADFMKRFFSTKLDGRKSNLDHYRI